MIKVTPQNGLLSKLGTQQFTQVGAYGNSWWEVLPGGAGGSIDTNTGLYTAPNAAGFDTIRVHDEISHEGFARIQIANYTLLPARVAMAKNLTKPFGAIGGTPPYVYRIVAPGVGSIDASTGIYTSPADIGEATVAVQDATGLSKMAKVVTLDPIGLVIDVIQQGMGLPDGRVYFWDQKIFQPTDFGLYIAVGVLSAKPFSNIRKYSDDGESEIQTTNFLTTLSLDIISRDLSAVERKEELVMALNSTYSELQQEANSFRIFPVPVAFVNLSQVDGAAIPYRFNISCNIQYAVVKSKSIDYYDAFNSPELFTNP